MNFHSAMIAQLDLNNKEIASLKQRVAMLQKELENMYSLELDAIASCEQCSHPHCEQRRQEQAEAKAILAATAAWLKKRKEETVEEFLDWASLRKLTAQEAIFPLGLIGLLKALVHRWQEE